MQGKEILRLVESLRRNKDIDAEVIFQAIESALESAARNHFGMTEDITVEIDRESGEFVALKDGERIQPEVLGRIAAQIAKQIFIQKIREAESETIHKEYSGRIGQLVSGVVQRFEGGSIIVNLERTEAVIPRSEQIPGEHYQAGERIRAVVADVRKFNNLVKVILSRSSHEFIRRLFELEVPEVAEGIVQMKKIAREPGLRTKVAVISLEPRVDCIGACVGVRGTRIKSIIDEVKGEKIDIIAWNDAPETLIADCLRPAEILQITLEEGEETKRAIVVVPEDQLAWAIGWKGQNVRLAVKMTGWDIDLEPPERTEEEKAEAEAEAAAEAAQEAAEEAAPAEATETETDEEPVQEAAEETEADVQSSETAEPAEDEAETVPEEAEATEEAEPDQEAAEETEADVQSSETAEPAEDEAETDLEEAEAPDEVEPDQAPNAPADAAQSPDSS